MELYYDKLVRDKIVKITESKGIKTKSYKCEDNEVFIKYLFDKLDEEIREFKELPSIEEMADIYEVLDSLKKFYKMEEVDVLKAQKEKRESKGGFGERIILLSTETKSKNEFL